MTGTGGGTPRTHRNRPTFTVEELSAAVEVARVHNSYVTVHCHATEAIARSLEAGVHMLEHATFTDPDNIERLDRDLAARIGDSGTVIVPTISVFTRWLERGASRVEQMTESDRRRYVTLRDSQNRRLELLNQLMERQIPIIAGSDAGGVSGEFALPFDDLYCELSMIQQAGASAMDAIRSATSHSADALGIAAETGWLAVGLSADVLAVDGDPTEDLNALRTPSMVMCRGQWAAGPSASDSTSESTR